MHADSNGVPRAGPPSDEDDMRIGVIGQALSPREQFQSGHRRGISESQDLLSFSERISYDSEKRKTFQYVITPVPECPEYPQKETPFETGVPQTLRQSRKKLFRGAIFDILFITIGFPFLALGVAVILFDGKEVTQKSEQTLYNCMKVSATVFPLVFSLVVGRALVKVASRKLEQGTTIGTLEQLMASRTVISTIITHLRLRPLSFFGLALIVLWLFSPAGSQAPLRMLSTVEADTTSPSNVSYVNTRQQSYSGNGFGSSWLGFKTLFGASLLAPSGVKSGSTDLWLNVKIPYFSTLPDVPMDDGQWVFLPESNFTPTYSSLFGIPISRLPVGTTNFTIDSTYIELSCFQMTSSQVRGEDRISSFQNPELISTAGPFRSASNVTGETSWALGYLGEDVTSQLPDELEIKRPCLDCLDTKDDASYSGILLYQDFTGTKNVTSVYCNPSQSCAVKAQRKSQLPHPPNSITLLSFSAVSEGISKFLPVSTPVTGVLDMLQNYLIEPLSNDYIQSSPFPYLDTSPTSTGESQLADISLQAFSQRLGQVLNAFLYGTMFNATNLLTTSANFDSEISTWTAAKPAFAPASNKSLLYSAIRRGFPALTVPASTTTTTHVFAVSHAWLSIFLLSAAILPLAALAAAVLKRKTLAGEYLGFVSTLARESGYFDGEAGCAALDGMQRARVMRDARVRLGDVGNVEGGHEVGTGVKVRVGRLAFGGRKVAKRLDRRKFYL